MTNTINSFIFSENTYLNLTCFIISLFIWITIAISIKSIDDKIDFFKKKYIQTLEKLEKQNIYQFPIQNYQNISKILKSITLLFVYFLTVHFILSYATAKNMIPYPDVLDIIAANIFAIGLWFLTFSSIVILQKTFGKNNIISNTLLFFTNIFIILVTYIFIKDILYRILY